MEVSKQDFDRFKSFIGPTSDCPEQSELLDKINFELEHHCDFYIGKYFPDEEWKKPDLNSVYEFFEGTLVDYESRYAEFLKNPSLTPEELKEFIQMRKTQYEEGESYPSTWTGVITCKDSEVIVFVSRWHSEDNELDGIFESTGTGIEVLYPDGEMLDEIDDFI